MSRTDLDGAAVITNQSSATGEWADMRTWVDPDGTWITETLCAELHAQAYFGDPPPAHFDLPAKIRWYELESLVGSGKIRKKRVSVQRPFPFQYRPFAYHKQDVLDCLAALDRTSLVDGSWNEFGGDGWTSKDGQAWGTDALINRTRRRPDETRFADAALYPSELSAFGVKVDHYTAKKQKGKVRFLDLDWPGGTRPRCKVYNLSDAAEAKRLVVAQDTERRKRQGAALKTIMKQHAVKTDNDGEWYSLRRAAAYLAKRRHFGNAKQLRGKLQRWKDDCPLLGRGIQMRSFHQSRNGAEEDYFFKADLDEIIRAEAKLRADRKTNTNGRLGAVETIGVSETTLNKFLPPDAKTTVNGLRTDGKPCKITSIDKEKLTKVAEYLAHPTKAETARILGTDTRTVNDLVSRGHLSVVPYPFGY